MGDKLQAIGITTVFLVPVARCALPNSICIVHFNVVLKQAK